MPHQRRRVCFVLPSLNGGGAERAAVQVLNGLAAAAWQRSMFLFERTGPYLADLDPAIDLHAASSPSIDTDGTPINQRLIGVNRWPARGERWQSLRRFIKNTRPDVVVAFLSYATVLTATRAAHIGARVVFNQQTPIS